MSFVCQKCGRAMLSGSKPYKIPVKTRNKVYSERFNVDNEMIDRGGSGWEVEQEISICRKCYELVKQNQKDNEQ